MSNLRHVGFPWLFWRSDFTKSAIAVKRHCGCIFILVIMVAIAVIVLV